MALGWCATMVPAPSVPPADHWCSSFGESNLLLKLLCSAVIFAIVCVFVASVRVQGSSSGATRSIPNTPLPLQLKRSTLNALREVDRCSHELCLRPIVAAILHRRHHHAAAQYKDHLTSLLWSMNPLVALQKLQYTLPATDMPMK